MEGGEGEGRGRLAGLAGQVEPHLCQPVHGVAQARSRKPGDSGGNVSVVPPFPPKTTQLESAGGRSKKEFAEDPLQTIPMSQACPESSLIGGWGGRGAAVLGLHSRRVVVSKGDSPGQTFSKEIQGSSGLPFPHSGIWPWPVLFLFPYLCFLVSLFSFWHSTPPTCLAAKCHVCR